MLLKRIAFIDQYGKVKLECNLNSLPLKEEKIIEKCIELFSDREPCILHKSFAMKKLFLEIDEYFRRILNEGREVIALEDVPEYIRELLSISNDIKRLELMGNRK